MSSNPPAKMALVLAWKVPQAVGLKRGSVLDFGDVAKGPGVYRIHCQMPGRPLRTYIGESANVRSRMRTYGAPTLTPAGSPPNRGLHRRLVNALRHGGTVSYELLKTPVSLRISGRSFDLDLGHEFDRRFVENAVLVDARFSGHAKIINAQRDQNVTVPARLPM